MSNDINLPIYMDYASTTPVDPRVAKKISDHLTMDGNFGNPASRSHKFGWKAEEAVEEARSHVANLVNCDPREIVWTSGATEADNLAIKGIANFRREMAVHPGRLRLNWVPRGGSYSDHLTMCSTPPTHGNFSSRVTASQLGQQWPACPASFTTPSSLKTVYSLKTAEGFSKTRANSLSRRTRSSTLISKRPHSICS